MKCPNPPAPRRIPPWLRLLLYAGTAAALGLFTGCSSQSEPGKTYAGEVTSEKQLIGGPNALGEVGDYLIENGKVRFIVQDKGYNEGNGLFGGSLMDADLRRPNATSDALGGNGKDTFGELFPAFFLEAIDPDTVRVVNKGGTDEPAIVEVAGTGGEFVTMLRYINQIMVNSYSPKEIGQLLGEAAQGPVSPPTSEGPPLARFKTRYILEPGARHLRIESTVENASLRELTFPNETVLNLLSDFLDLDLGNFTVPTGHVIGFTDDNDLFMPEIGYDLRWGLEEAYEQGASLPAFPGHIGQFLASSSDSDVSYGFATARSESSNFVYNKDQATNEQGEPYYGGNAKPTDMLMMFYAAGFTGVLTDEIPGTLAPSFCKEDEPAEPTCSDQFGPCDDSDTACQQRIQRCIDQYDSCLDSRDSNPSSFTYTNYFIVGDGTVSDVVDELYSIRGADTRKIAGRIRDAQTGEPVEQNVSLLIYKPRSGSGSLANRCSPAGSGDSRTEPTIFSQTTPETDGYVEFNLPDGEYCYRTHGNNRPLSDYHPLDVSSSNTSISPVADPRARVHLQITDANGQRIPAKLTVVGRHEYRPGQPKRDFLYDLDAGEPWRTTDMVPDQPDDPATRRYIEHVAYSGADGELKTRLRPGDDYTLYISRGPEYDLTTIPDDPTGTLSIEAGEVLRRNVTVERAISTDGYVSGDFHLHAAGSPDSGLNYLDRVTSIAAEDVEVVASSDHNYVSKYAPYIDRLHLDPFLHSMVGVELTTFEFGHFNAFPLEYDVGQVDRGSVPWQRLPPQRIFDALRQQGKFGPDDTIIQINHPRDSILGYFSQYDVDGFDASQSPAYKTAQGTQNRLIAGVTSSSGGSYLRDCRSDDVDCCPDGTNCDEPDFETTYSWDFDALEVFNGKRLDQLRHYRIPYAEGEWPDDVIDPALQMACDAESSCDQPSDLIRSRCCAAGYASPTDSDCPDASDPRDACPVPDIEQSLLSDRFPEDAILCDGDEIAYPGTLDDWYNMLNYTRPYIENTPGAPQSSGDIYQKITATGNSDSHHAHKPHLREPGHPRNYLRIGKDRPEAVTDRDVVDALKHHRNVVTNGPFALLEAESNADTAKIGDELQVDGDSVQLKILVRAADWVGADQFRVIANGEPLNVQNADPNGWLPIDFDEDSNEFVTTLDVPIDRDTWFVLEVRGDNSLFPVYPPIEIPQFPFDEVVGQIAGSFGFGGDIEGLAPRETRQMTPFAFTNPIWAVQSGDDFTPPSPDTGTCSDGAFDPNALTTDDGLRDNLERVKSRLDAVDVPLELPSKDDAPLSRPQGATRDVRTLFRAWGH